MKSDVVERAPTAAKSAPSMPNQEVDPRVAEADDGGAQQHDAELLNNAEMLELGVTDERTEHGVAVEHDGAAVIVVGLRQLSEGLDEDEKQRNDVHE